MDYDPWSYMISVVQGYLVNHLVSTKFMTVIARLLLYCLILDHPIAGSIVVTALNVKFSFFPFYQYEVGTYKIYI